MKSKKSIIVTGGSRGMGAQIVKDLANSGYNVILNYNKSQIQAEEIREELKNSGITIEIVKADITKREEVRSLMDFCIQKFHKIDALINNAGISQIKMFTDVTDDDWNHMIQTNLTANFYTTQEALKYMVTQKKGCIINISSIWGQTGASCEVPYSVAKAGLDGMTKSLAKEFGLSNIRVNSIAPGIINTQMNEDLLESEIDAIKKEIPLNRVGERSAISNCIKWLIEDNYTTGQVIPINGGWHIG